MNEHTEEADREALDCLLRGVQLSCILRVVAQIGLADIVPAEGEMPLSALAATCRVRPHPLVRMIRTLAAFDVFRVSKNDMIKHTPRSRLLRTDTRNSMHHGALFWTSPSVWASWNRLETALTGQVPHQVALGTDRFGYLRAHPDELAVFNAMMANFPDDRHTAIAEACRFENFDAIADIGGGTGATLRQVLAKAGSAKGILFDLAEVVERASAEDLLGGRIAVQAGSFFDRVPTGADAYLLVRVLHDWSDQDCLRILRTVRSAMSARSTLFIGEHLLQADPTEARPSDYLTDMQMMAMFGTARQRTTQEFESMLSASGFVILRTISTRSSVKVLEARLA